MNLFLNELFFHRCPKHVIPEKKDCSNKIKLNKQLVEVTRSFEGKERMSEEGWTGIYTYLR